MIALRAVLPEPISEYLVLTGAFSSGTQGRKWQRSHRLELLQKYPVTQSSR